MTDLVVGVEPERQEWAANQLARVTWQGIGAMSGEHIENGTREVDPGGWISLDSGVFIYDRQVTAVEPLIAVPAGFGERLAQQIEGQQASQYAYTPVEGRESYNLGLRAAAALVRREFTHPVSPETNGEQK